MGGQRDKAKRIACSCPDGSLGRDAICPNLEAAYRYIPIFQNACAGDVGDFYEMHLNDLKQPATDVNIERWAAMETTHFQQQGNCSALLGSMLSRSERAQLMKSARDRRKGSK